MPLWYSLMTLYNKFCDRRKAILKGNKKTQVSKAAALDVSSVLVAMEATKSKSSSKRKANMSTPSPKAAPRSTSALTIRLGPCAIGLRPMGASVNRLGKHIAAQPGQVFARGTVVSVKPEVSYPTFDECSKSERSWVVVKVGPPVANYGKNTFEI